MKKLANIKILGLAVVGYILFSAFKKKPLLKGSVQIYNYQDNAPSGTTQVFSKIGTTVYDDNFSVIYKYDETRNRNDVNRKKRNRNVFSSYW